MYRLAKRSLTSEQVCRRESVTAAQLRQVGCACPFIVGRFRSTGEDSSDRPLQSGRSNLIFHDARMRSSVDSDRSGLLASGVRERTKTEEFDPGSERTLAAWLRHASRTDVS